MKPRLKVKMTRKKGRGVFANCKIKKGEIIEIAPVIVLSKREARVIDTLLPLGSHFYQWGIKGEQTALVLGFGCIYNHSYAPNATYEHRIKKQETVFRALRNIHPGQEITHNYNGDPTSQIPIKFTWKSWHFVQQGKHKSR